MLKGTNLSIRPDMNIDDRKRLADAVTEIKLRRSSGEKDLVILDFRVVHKRPPRMINRPIMINISDLVSQNPGQKSD